MAGDFPFLASKLLSFLYKIGVRIFIRNRDADGWRIWPLSTARRHIDKSVRAAGSLWWTD